MQERSIEINIRLDIIPQTKFNKFTEKKKQQATEARTTREVIIAVCLVSHTFLFSIRAQLFEKHISLWEHTIPRILSNLLPLHIYFAENQSKKKKQSTSLCSPAIDSIIDRHSLNIEQEQILFFKSPLYFSLHLCQSIIT